MAAPAETKFPLKNDANHIKTSLTALLPFCTMKGTNEQIIYLDRRERMCIAMSSKLPAPIYIFLNYCDSSPLEKKILDCGAGGPNPPLSLFHESGYQTYGIEISEDQIYQSSLFCKEHNVHLNIIQGDMKDIPFQDVSFSFLFSYNTSVHIKKSDFSIAISEFFRVLQPGGLCYVNFLTHECSTYGAGTEINEGEFIQVDNDEDVLY